METMHMLSLIDGPGGWKRREGAFNPLSDPALVGWWTCDDGAGTTVADSSPNERNGTVVNGTAAWVPGMHAGAIELKIPVLVQVPAVNITMTQATMAGWLKRIGSQADWSSIMMTRGSATGFNIVGNALAYHWGDAATSWNYRPTAPIPDGEWTFCAVTVDPAKAVFYLNGAAVGTNTASSRLRQLERGCLPRRRRDLRFPGSPIDRRHAGRCLAL